MTWSTSVALISSDSDSSISTSSSIMSSSNTTPTYSYTSSNCSSMSMLLGCGSPPFSKNYSDCAVGNLHIYALKLDFFKWLIQILLHLEVIFQFSRHYKQHQCQKCMEYTCVYTNFSWLNGSFWMWWLTRWNIFEKLWRVWQFKWESTHQLWSTSHMQVYISCCAYGRQLYLLFALHVPKHL